MTWNAATFRKMANAMAKLEADNDTPRLAEDPFAQETAAWAREHRVKLDAKAEALDGPAPDELTLSLFD